MQSLPGGGGGVLLPQQYQQQNMLPWAQGSLNFNYQNPSLGAGHSTQQPGLSKPPTSGVYTTPIPNSPQYLQAQLLAKTAYQNALARLSSQRSGLLRNAGYQGKFDDTGKLTSMTVDPHNLYGGYQQMLRGAAMDDSQAMNSAAGRGMSGGLANRALSRLHYQHAGDATQFGTNLTNNLGDLANQQQDAFGQYNSALWQAEYQATQDAIQQQNFNLALGGGQNQAGGSDNGGMDAEQQYVPGGFSPQQTAAYQAALGAQNYGGRYYTYKAQVQKLLKPGQTIHYKPGRGYYPA